MDDSLLYSRFAYKARTDELRRSGPDQASGGSSSSVCV